MKRMIKMSIAAAMVVGIGSVSAQAEDAVSAISNIKVKGELRPRYEYVEAEDNNKSNANALTNRFTLGVSGDLSDSVSVFGEMTNVSALNNNYNSTDNAKTDNQVVVDPEQTRLTQGFVDIKMGKTLVRAGRQMVNLDNQRFVGAVGWRQMFQTFDAILLSDNSVDNLNLAAAYVTGVNAVKNVDTANTRSAILHAAYKVDPALNVTAYSYMIGSVHNTNGLALTGDVALSDGMKLNYRAEYANQTGPTMTKPSGGNAENIHAEANYQNFEIGLNMSGLLVGVGRETLSGYATDDTNAKIGNGTEFSTPLATLHAHNGWADIFLAGTGYGAGLVDTSVMVGYKAKDFGTAKIIYHTFAAEAVSGDYGKEIDFVYTNKITSNLTGMFKGAMYTTAMDAIEFNGSAPIAASYDATKVWLMLDYKFASN